MEDDQPEVADGEVVEGALRRDVHVERADVAVDVVGVALLVAVMEAQDDAAVVVHRDVVEAVLVLVLGGGGRSACAANGVPWGRRRYLSGKDTLGGSVLQMFDT